jgi:hypothetical protein
VELKGWQERKLSLEQGFKKRRGFGCAFFYECKAIVQERDF